MAGNLTYRPGLIRAAAYIEGQHQDKPELARAMRTLADGDIPCRACGYPEPTHSPSCLSSLKPRGE